MVTRRHTESLAACPYNKDRPTSFHFISFHREVITEKKQIVWIIQTRVILENIIGHFTRSLGGFAPLLQVHLIYSKNAKVYYSYTTTLWRHDINMRWDANMLLTPAFSRKQYILWVEWMMNENQNIECLASWLLRWSWFSSLPIAMHAPCADWREPRQAWQGLPYHWLAFLGSNNVAVCVCVCFYSFHSQVLVLAQRLIFSAMTANGLLDHIKI